MTTSLEERVDNLEQLMAQLIQTVDQTSREMREFKDEMRDFKDEMRRRWGELSNKLGTMAEDLVTPSIPRILPTLVDCPSDSINSAVRVRRRTVGGQTHEFDVVATCGDYLFVNETKSKLRPEDVTAFVEETLPMVRDFFPEYADKQIIGIIASLYIDETLVRYAERQGLVVLGFGEDVMDILNSAEFVPKTW